MSREWKPGDVAMVSAYNKSEPYRAYFDGKTWRQCDGNAFCVDQPTSHRPLVVIDPEDRERVERLLRDYFDAASISRHAASKMQAALRSLVTDPKPEEPQGLGAVVENDQGRRFIRQHDGWWRGDEPCTLNWAAVHAVTVLSAGWSE